MSEYQYYEFRAVDRPLGEREMAELRELSTRAEITPTGFVNTYNWGDFRGDPYELMEKYFDAFVYVANWGTHRFMLRVPRRFLDTKVASVYCTGEELSLRVKGEHVLLEFVSDIEEAEGWVEGEGWLPSMITLRADLLRGDLRGLYLGWLACLWTEELDDDASEPPVPPGLCDMTAPLSALADFLRLDADLLEVASEASVGDAPPGPSPEELEKWIRGLPDSERTAMLLQLAREEPIYARAEMLRRFREASVLKHPQQARERESGRRTVGELLAAAEKRAEERCRIAAKRAATKKARREREEAIARERHLDDLAQREGEAWREVEGLIGVRRQKEYDQAVTLVTDLREVAAMAGKERRAETRIRQLWERHARKTTLLERLRKAGLAP